MPYAYTRHIRLTFNSRCRHDPSLRGNGSHCSVWWLWSWSWVGGGVVVATGLEASRAPYSKSHARRLKRREKEQLTAGGLGSLKAALPSIAPTTRRTTAATTIIGDRSAGEELDAAAATTNTSTTRIANANAAAIDDASVSVSVKPMDKSKSKSKQLTTDQPEVPPQPQPPVTRPGQIGEGHGAPLMRSQRRRRALYGTYFYHCQPVILRLRAIVVHHLFFLDSRPTFLTFATADRKAERFRQPLIRSNPEFAANPFETIRTHARNTLVPYRPTM